MLFVFSTTQSKTWGLNLLRDLVVYLKSLFKGEEEKKIVEYKILQSLLMGDE